jgi:NitT/TauT family transport system permease protein
MTSSSIRRKSASKAGPGIWALRGLLLAVVLLSWEFVPRIAALHSVSPVFNPFFISSPSRIYERLVELSSSHPGRPSIWQPLSQTLKATFLGVGIGTAMGAAAGLLLSNSRRAQLVLEPFLTLLNATPRIALVPIFVIIAGPTTTASVATAIAVVFFVVFYNARAGGMSVPSHVINNARILGASGGETMLFVRLRYVLIWTFASLPNAISFGLVSVVTAELLTGQIGMGRLLLDSITNVDATLTFVVVAVLAVAGVILVTAAELISRRATHWWETS